MLRVVVIDSSAISRNLLISVLTNGGHQVVGDSNASPAGLASMIKLQPQLVCIDLGSGGQWQMDLLETIRAALPKALVFIVSGAMDPVFVQRAIECGTHGFIVKPFNAVSVLGTICNAIIKVAKRHQAA
jgi:two-component system chemotaxis response regulator CheY